MAAFNYDISRQANYGGTNTLVVRVDATRNEGWFYEGAGIYRHVWLVITGATHVAHWGTFVTSTIDNRAADVSAQTTVRNDSPQPVNAKVTSVIADSDGRAVAVSDPVIVAIDKDGEQTLTQKLKVPDAQLWSLENPHLYKLISRVEVTARSPTCMRRPSAFVPSNGTRTRVSCSTDNMSFSRAPPITRTPRGSASRSGRAQRVAARAAQEIRLQRLSHGPTVPATRSCSTPATAWAFSSSPSSAASATRRSPSATWRIWCSAIAIIRASSPGAVQ